MSKLNKLSLCLTDKFPLSDVDSDNFVSTLFTIIRERLESDRLVKVKGLGTFKLTEMNARDSVDINTGERIRIEGRYKLSFTPENAVRDRINSPFASFESVDLDDENIDFASIDEKYYAKESINPIIANAVEVESVEEKLLVVPVHLSFTEKTDTDNKKSTDEITEKPIIEQNDKGADIRNNTVVVEQSVIHENTESCIAEQTSQPEGDKILEPETVPHNTHCEVLIKDDIDYSKKILMTLRWILALVIVVLACVGAYFIYDIGRDNGTKAYYKHNSSVESRKEKIPNNNPVDVEKTYIVSVSDKSVEKPQQKAEVNSDKKTVDENSAATNPNDIYNKDARVRTGAYNIIGLDQMVTVRAGQTLKGISKAYFGEGMECYIEAYNGVTSVKEGDTLRIPKLQLKKKSKKK